MLPATFQTPAAIVLLLGGLLACFAGYRVFRIVLAIYGFILGVLLASSFMGTEQTLWMILTWIAGGLAGRADPAGRLFRGRGAARAPDRRGAAHVIWASFRPSPRCSVLILFSIAGALAALALQRYVIIISTAFGGAQTALVGAAALLGRFRRGTGGEPCGVTGSIRSTRCPIPTGTRPPRSCSERSAFWCSWPSRRREEESIRERHFLDWST